VNVDLRYLGKSEIQSSPSGATLHFSPNLARPKVFFDAELRHPCRFREAMSALHDVVVSDLRFKKKDKTAYEAWRRQQAEEEAELRRKLGDKAKLVELEQLAREPLPPDLEKDFRRLHRLYWDARVRWANELARSDPQLFRHLVPCDPVVTVAPDVLFFEGFSKDESAYGCLTVDRDALRGDDAGLGTTNVDYSLALYEHFQALRSYRPTRLLVDPTGFEVKVDGREDYREEKIDLPSTWLRGFGQLQAAMTLPSRKIELPVEAVYSILAHLKRHREKTGPRSIRFQLTPGKPPVVILDPWGVVIPCRGPIVEDLGVHPLAPITGSPPSSWRVTGFTGPSEVGRSSAFGGPYRIAPVRLGRDLTEEIKVWGRRRLFALARVLPLAERVEVRLLGSGLPSIWIAHLGEMRFVLALSGWTANDWTSGSNLEMLSGASRIDPRLTGPLLHQLEEAKSASLLTLVEKNSAPEKTVLSSLHLLAKQGQVIYDFWADRYRHRQVMPVALSDAVLGPEHPELAEGRSLARLKKVNILREEALPEGRRLFVFKVNDTSAEAIVDADGAFRKAKCTCSFFYRNRLRAGPCRHLIALRIGVLGGNAPPPSTAVPPPPPSTPFSAAPVDPVIKPAVERAPSSRREEVVSFTADVLDEAKRRASTEDRGLSEIVEEAWDLAFERLVAVSSWKEALRMVDAARARPIEFRAVESPKQQSLLLDGEILREIARVAGRLGASPSAVVNLAWLIARRKR
jgi:hypothetical protein